MYPSKNINLCLFYASEKAKVLKKTTRCVSHLSGPQHFHHHPGGGVGWQWGVGGKPLNRAKVRSWQKCGRLFTDCRPHRPLIIFCLIQKMWHFTCKFKRCKQNKIQPSFDQVMTYYGRQKKWRFSKIGFLFWSVNILCMFYEMKSNIYCSATPKEHINCPAESFSQFHYTLPAAGFTIQG